MNKYYFSPDSQLLLEGGVYKSIGSIAPGDKVLAANLDPVKVVSVQESTAMPLVEVRHQNWYEPIYCSPHTMFLVVVEIVENNCQLRWTPAIELKTGMVLITDTDLYENLPETFSVKFENTSSNAGKAEQELELVPSYDLGMLFGLFAGYGAITENNVEFHFGPSETIINTVKNLLQKLLGADSNVKKDEFNYQLICQDPTAVKIFTEFGSKVQRQIPKKYWVKHEEFVRGIFEGLIDFDAEQNLCRYISVSDEMGKAFVWLTSTFNIIFQNDTHPPQQGAGIKMYPLFLSLTQEAPYLTRVVSIKPEARVEKGWTIEIEHNSEENLDHSNIIINHLAVRL